jgi:hypothetical protein
VHDHAVTVNDERFGYAVNALNNSGFSRLETKYEAGTGRSISDLQHAIDKGRPTLVLLQATCRLPGPERAGP